VNSVLAKARAAARWCSHASSHELAHKGKPWRYLLIPHDEIADNKTLQGFADRFTFPDQPENAVQIDQFGTVSGAIHRVAEQANAVADSLLVEEDEMR
jgi:hypothetical protein